MTNTKDSVAGLWVPVFDGAAVQFLCWTRIVLKHVLIHTTHGTQCTDLKFIHFGIYNWSS